MTPTLSATRTRATHRREVPIVGAALTAADLLVLFLSFGPIWDAAERGAAEGRIAPQDLWMPLGMVVIALAVANGILLTAWPRSRQVGVGILVGAGVAAVLLVLLVAISLTVMHQ